MKSVNEVRLLGHLGEDPEVKKTSCGKLCARLSIATNDVWKDQKGQKQEKTYWHRVILWEGLAEIAKKYLTKGAPVYVAGKLQTRKYDNGDGTRYITEVIGMDLVMLSSKEAKEVNSPARSQQNNPEITDEDIPF